MIKISLSIKLLKICITSVNICSSSSSLYLFDADFFNIESQNAARYSAIPLFLKQNFEFKQNKKRYSNLFVIANINSFFECLTENIIILEAFDNHF